MAFNSAPNTWVASWSEDGTDITVPIATFSELTAAEADGTTGDIRKVLFAICEHLWSQWNTKGSANQPTQMTIARSSTVNESTDQITKRYTFTFVTESTGTEVVAES